MRSAQARYNEMPPGKGTTTISGRFRAAFANDQLRSMFAVPCPEVSYDDLFTTAKTVPWLGLPDNPEPPKLREGGASPYSGPASASSSGESARFAVTEASLGPCVGASE